MLKLVSEGREGQKTDGIDDDLLLQKVPERPAPNEGLLTFHG